MSPLRPKELVVSPVFKDLRTDYASHMSVTLILKTSRLFSFVFFRTMDNRRATQPSRMPAGFRISC